MSQWVGIQNAHAYIIFIKLECRGITSNNHAKDTLLVFTPFIQFLGTILAVGTATAIQSGNGGDVVGSRLLGRNWTTQIDVAEMGAENCEAPSFHIRG